MAKKIEIEVYPGEWEEIVSIEEFTRPYVPKAKVVICDELAVIMKGSDYRAINTISEKMSNIARLGRAAAFHLALCCQRASSDVINKDLENNIYQKILLGDFDSSASGIMFDKDISHLAKGHIKGRAFMSSTGDLKELQTYWTEQKKDFDFKEEVKARSREELISIYGDPDIQKPTDVEFNTTPNDNSFIGDAGDGIKGDLNDFKIDFDMGDFKNKDIEFGKNEKDLFDNEITDDLEFKGFEDNENIDFESKTKNNGDNDNDIVENFQETETENKNETKNIKIKLNSNLTNTHASEDKPNTGAHKIKLSLDSVEKIKINSGK